MNENQVLETSASKQVGRRYYMQLLANLLNACPVDTRNMITHIVMYETADNYVIEINAPYSTNPKVNKSTINGKSDYAYDVNYANRSPHKNWVEDQIKLTERIVGARVIFLDKI